MIHFALRCSEGAHGFDGWFRNGEDFERQLARGLVSCPACGSTAVEKALMRPAVSTARAARPAAAPAGPAPGEAMVAAPPVELVELHRRMQEMSRKVRAEAHYVGPRFAEEARRIHYGESEERRIYGEASPPEVRELLEEGIGALPLPPLPEDKN